MALFGVKEVSSSSWSARDEVELDSIVCGNLFMSAVHKTLFSAQLNCTSCTNFFVSYAHACIHA